MNNVDQKNQTHPMKIQYKAKTLYLFHNKILDQRVQENHIYWIYFFIQSVTNMFSIYSVTYLAPIFYFYFFVFTFYILTVCIYSEVL